MEEGGDPELLVLATMVYERESSKTENSVMPAGSELGEGVFIPQEKIQPLPLASSAE